MRIVGVARAVVAVVAGAGLVWGATEATGVADTSRHTDASRVVADTTSSTVAGLTLTCPGSDSQATLQAASMPAQWLADPSSSSGSVDLQAGATHALALQHGASTSSPIPVGSAVSLAGKGSLATGLVASITQVDASRTARGLNVSSCAQPTQDGWFFGGGDAAGRVARLTLVNPSAESTTVNVVVVGASGPESSAGVQGTVVGPHERKVLTLGNFGPPLSSAAIHLTASGSGVVAALTDAWMTGETPVGENTSTSAVEPANTLVIPGVSATSAQPVIRLAVPGKDQAIVRVRATNPAGAVVSDTVRTVAGGASDEVSLTGLAAGNYSVTVTADEPVVAAAMSRTASSGTTDLTWSTPVQGTSAPAGVAVPTGVPGESTSLMLTAGTTTAAEVVTVTASGATTSKVTVPGDRPVVLPLKDATAVWVRPVAGGRLQGALTVSGRSGNAGLIADVPLQPVVLTQSTTRLLPARG